MTPLSFLDAGWPLGVYHRPKQRVLTCRVQQQEYMTGVSLHHVELSAVA